MAVALMLAYWGVAVWGCVSSRPVLVYLFFGSIPLGTFTVVPPGMLGGVSLLASSMSSMLLAGRMIFLAKDGGRALAEKVFRSPFTTTLSGFWLVSILVTVFVPRFRAGAITVIALSGRSYGPAPLGPTTQNFTQMTYLTVSVLAVLAFARVFRSDDALALLVKGVLVADCVAIVTGVADYLSAYLPTAVLLTPFRTANYSIMENSTLGDGARRVIGLMPESSAFGYVTMALFSLTYFLRPALPDELMRRRFGQLSLGLGVMTVLSTSSAGYAALMVAVALMALHWTMRTGTRPQAAHRRRGTRRELFVALGVVAAILVVAIVHPDTLRPVAARLEELLLSKRDTDSYAERSMWTRVSFQAGISSGLLGVGLGSSRASNYAAVLFSSTGAAGTLLYVAFAGRLLVHPTRGISRERREIVAAMRWSYFPILVINLMIGASADFGVLDAMRWGVIVASLEAGARTSIRSTVAADLERRRRQRVLEPAPSPALLATGRGRTIRVDNG